MQELAELLGTTEEQLKRLDNEMSVFTGKEDVLQLLSEELEQGRKEILSQLGLNESVDRGKVLVALKERVAGLEEKLISVLKRPDCRTPTGCQFLIETALGLAKPPKSFFLKEEKARELLLANPPKGVMDVLGYSDPAEMVEKEDLFELFASLRFVEEQHWLNEVFFAPYRDLTPDDFEKREIQIRVLGEEKWGGAAAAFMRKKFHNLSHLKELGVVFTLPAEPAHGVTLRLFSLLVHYLHEVSFYAKYVEQCAGEPESFASNFLAALRGDVRETVPPIENLSAWLVIQRYLAKGNPDDPRLAMPHVSSEALLWKMAMADLGRFGKKHPDLGLDFWAGRDFIVGLFDKELTSFNFEDNVFSAVPGADDQYTYHVREALWNQLFISYLNEKALETLLVESLGQGFIGFKIRSAG